MAGYCIQTVRFLTFLVIVSSLTIVVSCNREQSSTNQAPATTAQTATPSTPATPAPSPSTTAPAASAPSAAPTPADFNRLQLGMTTEQVRQLVGNPSKVEQKGQKVEWKYYTSQGKLEIEFLADKIASIEKE